MKSLLSLIAIFQFMYGDLIQSTHAKQKMMDTEMTLLQIQNEAQIETFKILNNKDKVKRNEKLRRRISRYFKSLRRFERRIEKKSNKELENEIKKLKIKMISKSVPEERQNILNKMITDLKNGNFRSKLKTRTSLEQEDYISNTLIESLDYDVFSKINNENYSSKRSPAGLDGIINLWVGGDTEITGIFAVDLIIHIIAFPIVFLSGVLAFGLIGVGLILYGLFYCAPKYLVTGESSEFC